MENMRKNLTLVPFFAVLTLLLVSMVAAGEVAYTSSVDTEFNGVSLGQGDFYVGNVANTVPVRVTFKAIDDATDVKVKVYIEGHRDDVSVSTDRFDVIEGGVYTKLLNLRLPSDANDLAEDYTLYVELVSATDKTTKTYDLKVQRESYTLEILSVDYDSSVSAGQNVLVNVVAKNNGYNDADDNYVVVSIPELGVSSRGYLGDLVAVEDNYDNDNEDASEKTVALRIPENSQAGVYELVVEVYNEDSSVVTKKLISVGDSESLKVFAGAKNKDLREGESVTYDLVIVNSGDDIKVFNLETVSSSALDVEVPSIVTVRPDSSETVAVKVTADDDAREGSYTFTVSVDGRDVSFGANVVDGRTSDSTVALIVVLAIVFIVLLAILISLLARRETKYKEVEETSYY